MVETVDISNVILFIVNNDELLISKIFGCKKIFSREIVESL